MFDAFKENQFEEFWGQKQKLDWQALAGESAKLKLDVMIRNGVFKEGDIFSYYRVIGRVNKTVLEKDCKVCSIRDRCSYYLLIAFRLSKSDWTPSHLLSHRASLSTLVLLQSQRLEPKVKCRNKGLLQSKTEKQLQSLIRRWKEAILQQGPRR